MTAATVTLPPIEKYATYTRTITWTDALGVGISLTGCDISMMIKLTQMSTDVLFQLSTIYGGITITDALNGVFQLYISSGDTATMPVESMVYDIVVTFSNSTKVRLIQGTISVIDGVTYE